MSLEYPVPLSRISLCPSTPSLTLGMSPIPGPINIRPSYHRGRTLDPLLVPSKNYLELLAAQPLPAVFPSLPSVLSWAIAGSGDAPGTEDSHSPAAFMNCISKEHEDCSRSKMTGISVTGKIPWKVWDLETYMLELFLHLTNSSHPWSFWANVSFKQLARHSSQEHLLHPRGHHRALN